MNKKNEFGNFLSPLQFIRVENFCLCWKESDKRQKNRYADRNIFLCNHYLWHTYFLIFNLLHVIPSSAKRSFLLLFKRLPSTTLYPVGIRSHVPWDPFSAGGHLTTVPWPNASFSQIFWLEFLSPRPTAWCSGHCHGSTGDRTFEYLQSVIF
jgi:hypothetical protein